MAKIKYVQLEPEAFLADFLGLTPEQRGSYATICFKLYGGSIQFHNTSLAILCATDPEHFRTEIWPAISHKFSVTNGSLAHKRVTKELKIAREHHKNRQKAANKRWSKADAKHIQSNANQNQNQKGNSKKKPKPQKNIYSVEFLKFWQLYPKRWIPSSDTHVKVGKDLAWEQWRRIGDDTHRHILGIISQMKPGKSVPDAWRWLRDKKFKDYDPPKPPDPKIEAERVERERQKQREEYGKHYRSKTTEELREDLKSYGCFSHRFLIKEILAERNND